MKTLVKMVLTCKLVLKVGQIFMIADHGLERWNFIEMDRLCII